MAEKYNYNGADYEAVFDDDLPELVGHESEQVAVMDEPTESLDDVAVRSDNPKIQELAQMTVREILDGLWENLQDLAHEGTDHPAETAAKYQAIMETIGDWRKMTFEERGATLSDMSDVFKASEMTTWSAEVDHDWLARSHLTTGYINDVILPKLEQAANGTAEQYQDKGPLDYDTAARFVRDQYPQCARLAYDTGRGEPWYQGLDSEDMDKYVVLLLERDSYSAQDTVLSTLSGFAAQNGNQELAEKAITLFGYVQHQEYLSGERGYPSPTERLVLADINVSSIVDTANDFIKEMRQFIQDVTVDRQAMAEPVNDWSELSTKYSDTMLSITNWSNLNNGLREQTTDNMMNAFRDAGLDEWASLMKDNIREFRQKELTGFERDVVVPRLMAALTGTGAQYPTDVPLDDDTAAKFVREQYPRCASAAYDLNNDVTYGEPSTYENVMRDLGRYENAREYRRLESGIQAMQGIVDFAHQQGHDDLERRALTAMGVFEHDQIKSDFEHDQEGHQVQDVDLTAAREQIQSLIEEVKAMQGQRRA